MRSQHLLGALWLPPCLSRTNHCPRLTPSTCHCPSAWSSRPRCGHFRGPIAPGGWHRRNVNGQAAILPISSSVQLMARAAVQDRGQSPVRHMHQPLVDIEADVESLCHHRSQEVGLVQCFSRLTDLTRQARAHHSLQQRRMKRDRRALLLLFGPRAGLGE